MAYVWNNSTVYTLRVKGLNGVTFLGRANQKGCLQIPEEGVYEIHVRYGERGLALLQRGLIKKDDQIVFAHEDVEAQVKRTKKYVAAKAEAERQKVKEAAEAEVDAVTKKMAPLSVSSGGSSGASTKAKAPANLYDVSSDDSDLDFDDE